MKNLPLSLQIWLVFAAITLSISLLLALLLPWTLRDFFTREIYATIESSQSMLLYRFPSEFSRDTLEAAFPLEQGAHLRNIRAVNHLVISGKNWEVIVPRLPVTFLNVEFFSRVKEEIQEQRADSQRYSGQIEDRKLFYVITRISSISPSSPVAGGQDIFLVSYMWDSYREDLVQTLFKRIILIMGSVFLLSWVPSLGLSRYLSNPLVALEKRVKKLAARDWQQPIQLQRKDEIGRLAQSIEYLRNQLVSQDEIQQSFLQHISHELKTPVMTIRSYAQAIRDGIYPKGDLSATVQVVEEEAGRLEKRIHNLLYLTKLDYLATYSPAHGAVALDKLIGNVVERLRWRRSELEWSLELSPLQIRGDLEQWRVVLENILDNQVRYARRRVLVSLSLSEDPHEKAALLHIWNDGPAIEPEVMAILFHKFNRGYKGEFGLGLAIAYRIVSLHNAKIWAKNEEEGVSFYLKIPSLIDQT